MWRYAFLVVLLLSTVVVSADVIHLKDGTTLDGTVKKSPHGWTVTGANGKAKTVASDQIQSISLTGREASAGDAMDLLASLRRAVANISDVKQIIQKYQNFIARNASTPAAKEARKDLANWQDRLDRGLVKVGDQWVTPEQRDALKEKSIAEIDHIRHLLRAGRISEAEPLLIQALNADPSNPSLQFLKGLVLYRQNQIVPARKAFETANQELPNHAPTLNNLAVIAIRQNRSLLALGFLYQAMLAAPQSAPILDNVAETLNAIPAEATHTPIGQKVAVLFAQQDPALSAKMEKRGLYRWGARWVTAQQREQLQAVEKEMKSKLDALAAQYDAANARVASIDRTIADNQRTMNEYQSYAYNAANNSDLRSRYGSQYQVALPPTYYELQHDNEKLAAERKTQIAKLDQLRRQARELQKEYPVPKYTGVLKMIDVEGTPVDLPDAPATQPTSQPDAGSASVQPATQPAP